MRLPCAQLKGNRTALNVYVCPQNLYVFSYAYLKQESWLTCIEVIKCGKSASFFCSDIPATVPRKQPFARHLSFDQICEVATIEREKLSSVEGNQRNELRFLFQSIYQQFHVMLSLKEYKTNVCSISS